MFSWDDLRVFLAVQRCSSHAAAARVLKLDSTTVGRRIASLETAIGARLFARSPAAVLLTDAGKSLFEHAERVEREIVSLHRELTGLKDTVSGVVRVTAADGLTTFVLVPRLLTLRRVYPALRVELLGDNQLLDLSRREADVAVRLARPLDNFLVAKRVGKLEMGVFGSASYFAERKCPLIPEDLKEHDWIAHEAVWDATAESHWFQQYVSTSRLVLRTRTTTALVSACASGYGLAVLPVPFANSDSRIIRVLEHAEVPTRELWAVTHQDLRRSAPVSAAMRWLEAVLSLEGRSHASGDASLCLDPPEDRS